MHSLFRNSRKTASHFSWNCSKYLLLRNSGRKTASHFSWNCSRPAGFRRVTEQGCSPLPCPQTGTAPRRMT
ncbi:MAG: hypothetical protein EOQ47_28465 [Mesorhizobium sp.]|nr:MAG: hypothetical protein EOQ47_28465 [Mesorhizobium sp.]TKB15206.1 MAG: hypothetical protein E5V75_16550 [Mesorhizobium sp.]